MQAVSLATNPQATVQTRRDLFDNTFARCYYPDHEAELFFDFALEIDLHEQNPFAFLLDYDAANYPFKYTSADTDRLAPYLTFSDARHFGADPAVRILPLPFWNVPTDVTPTVSLLTALIDAVHGRIVYERRDEGAARSPAETLQLGRGSCRDAAVLLAAILRELGLAARLVSGYLCLFGQEARDRHVDASMHMWAEVYLPGAGWTGLDASNGVFCDQKYIATAVGLTTAEITPISGRYFSNEAVASNMTASIKLTAL